MAPSDIQKAEDQIGYFLIGFLCIILLGIIYAFYDLFKGKFGNTDEISNEIKKRFIKNKPFTVVYYSYKNCPFCMEFNPEWEKFVRRVQYIKGIKTEKIDSLENPERILQDSIESFPTIKINDVVYDFDGEPRTADLLYSEVIKQFSQIDSSLI